MTVTQTTRPSRARTSSTAAQQPAAKEDGHHEFNLNLPFVKIQVRPPELHLPHVELPHVSRRDVGQAVDIARTFLPPPERIAYYGGLGALAALGLIDWPVAAAIGAGTMIAQRTRAQERWSPLRGQQKETPASRAERTAERARDKAMEKAAQTTQRGSRQKTEPKAETKTAARSGTSGRARRRASEA